MFLSMSNNPGGWTAEQLFKEFQKRMATKTATPAEDDDNVARNQFDRTHRYLSRQLNSLDSKYALEQAEREHIEYLLGLMTEESRYTAILERLDKIEALVSRPQVPTTPYTPVPTTYPWYPQVWCNGTGITYTWNSQTKS